MPNIDFEAVDRPKFTRPELLRHGTIPLPLLGVSPRSIEGSVWWDTIRRRVYSWNNMRCFACGGPGPLAAHEVYDIDYRRGRSIFVEVVALCEPCHDFIHIGRLISLLSRSEISLKRFKKTVIHGYETLQAAGLMCPASTRLIANTGMYFKMDMSWTKRILSHCDTFSSATHDVPWEDWRLVYNGREYPPKFASAAEASRHYLTEE